MILSAVYALVCRLLQLIVLVGRSERSKELEILVLRHELAILRRQPRRPQFSPSDRLLLAALSRVLPRRSWGAFPVTPETLLRWHRRLLARHWTYSGRRPGRPRMAREVRVLILRLARENATWGYVRITGELRKLGIEVSPSLVRNRRRSCCARAARKPRSVPTARRRIDARVFEDPPHARGWDRDAEAVKLARDAPVTKRAILVEFNEPLGDEQTVAFASRITRARWTRTKVSTTIRG